MESRSAPLTSAPRSSAPGPSIREATRGVQILAKSIYRDLAAQGYSEQQIVQLATELIGIVTDNLGDSDISP